MARNLYCFDTNALIDGWRTYHPDIFGPVWRNLERLIRERRAFSSTEVEREIKQWSGKGELLEWVKAQDGFFREADSCVMKRVGEITDQTDLVDEEAQKSTADPFVIGLALCEKARVVTHEGHAAPQARMKVPDVCRKFDVSYTRFLGVIKQENWRF